MSARKKKRTYLLLEMLIGLSLMSLLLTLLFSFFAQNMKVEQKMQRARMFILERQNIQMRLQDLLISLCSEKENPPLYTQVFPKEEKESLFFSFDNGIDPDPRFSGVLRGRLHLDGKRNLCLTVWPQEKGKDLPWRKEVLLPEVQELSFAFLGEKTASDPKEKSINALIGWSSHWEKEKRSLPAFIQMSLRQRDKNLQFAFQLPVSHLIPTYFEGGYRS